ncbi:Gldg family protein [Aurantiacibacter poecillastricola]|uniref:Gldg family protein n=1 Tax=Aurantiacibacter poecillastricola TaxID=3064385 RepID=UPI00273F7C1D|nr:ABC transporter [Aurantiacibacter sp. 219JJ12-13]MDP5262875.1 ABC transporter [Aurantiacibacter sp. 219JJ12-13]
MFRLNRFLGALALLLAPVAAQAEDARAELALMGTVPIYWGEAAGLDDLLSGAAPPHWARGVLEEDFTLVPLDYLSAEALAEHRFLLLAQPRGFSPEENVALDRWVREGGTLLLFADPMMTGESRFHLGDRRRPQDVTLLSPILAHWGLELVFDAQQAGGLRMVDHFGDALPVNMRGELRPLGEAGSCGIPGEGLLAHCVIGKGQALIVADAAMLDIEGPHENAETALRWLVGHVFGDQLAENGDGAGNGLPESPQTPEIRVEPPLGQGMDRAHHEERVEGYSP